MDPAEREQTIGNLIAALDDMQTTMAENRAKLRRLLLGR